MLRLRLVTCARRRLACSLAAPVRTAAEKPAWRNGTALSAAPVRSSAMIRIDPPFSLSVVAAGASNDIPSLAVDQALGLPDSNFAVCNDDQATMPAFDVFRLINRLHFPEERVPTRFPQPHEKDTVVSTGCKSPNVRKIKILSNQEAPSLLCRLSYL